MFSPTKQTYQEFQDAYSYFNAELFDDLLPDCLITMQRKGRSLGYFCRGRFADRNGSRTDEIALNPSFFRARGERGVLSTLCHEMAHLFQYHFGDPGRRGYHNREWANRMVAIGLYPSNTGKPGGRETGYQVTQYIVQGGPFDVTCTRLLTTGFQFSWQETNGISNSLMPATTAAAKGATDGSNRCKFTCPACGFNAWAKPSGALICGFCRVVDMLRKTR